MSRRLSSRQSRTSFPLAAPRVALETEEISGNSSTRVGVPQLCISFLLFSQSTVHVESGERMFRENSSSSTTVSYGTRGTAKAAGIFESGG